MRRANAPTNATATAFQLGALLIVGTGTLLILAYDLIHAPAPVASPHSQFGMEYVASQKVDAKSPVP